MYCSLASSNHSVKDWEYAISENKTEDTTSKKHQLNNATIYHKLLKVSEPLGNQLLL